MEATSGLRLKCTLRFCTNSNNSANASQSLGVPPWPHRFSILFCFARDFFEKVWAMGLRAGETPICIILHSCNTMQVFLLYIHAIRKKTRRKLAEITLKKELIAGRSCEGFGCGQGVYQQY